MSDITERNAISLFKAFEVIWGPVWLNRYGDDRDFKLMVHEWGLAIDGMSPEQIRDNLEYCKVTYQYPPSISQFVNPNKKGLPNSFGSNAYHADRAREDAERRSRLRLPSDKAKAVAKESIAKLKGMLP